MKRKSKKCLYSYNKPKVGFKLDSLKNQVSKVVYTRYRMDDGLHPKILPISVYIYIMNLDEKRKHI